MGQSQPSGVEAVQRLRFCRGEAAIAPLAWNQNEG